MTICNAVPAGRSVGRTRGGVVAKAALFLAAASLLAACTAAPAPRIPVDYTAESDVAALAGHWWGDYGSVESGRHGRVRFTLEADAAEATGDVLMIPHREVEGEVAAPHGQLVPTSLRVRFVRIQGNTVVGALEPYDDPGCGCQVSTTFIGELDGASIVGTYVSEGGRMHLGHSGRWQVERRAEVAVEATAEAPESAPEDGG